MSTIADTQPQLRPEPTMNGSAKDAHGLSRKRSKYERGLLGRYRLLRTLGTGNFAKVKLAIHLLTNKEVAIKIIDKHELSVSSRQKLSREINLMKQLDHPNIIKLLEIIETDRMTYLVLEYANKGELYEYLANHGRMKEKVAREKFRQILSAVEYCHQKHIIHRDLKMENLLLDDDLNIKLADFGFANEYEEGKKLNTFCGSPPYAAPELFRGKEYNGPEVDVWSLGVILFKLVTGNLPFDGHSLSELRERVLRGKYRIPFFMSTECERLIKKMLLLNPTKRHNLQSIMKDPWVNTDYETEPLMPYEEPKTDSLDPVRVESLMNMGFNLDAISKSLKSNAFDEITTTYFLLQRHSTCSKDSTGDDDDPTEKVLVELSESTSMLKGNISDAKNASDHAPQEEEDNNSKHSFTNGVNGEITAVQANSAEVEVSTLQNSRMLKRDSTEGLMKDALPTMPVCNVEVQKLSKDCKWNGTNKPSRIVSPNGYGPRPKTTYETVAPDRFQPPEHGERRVPNSHWYPTGGLAVHNWMSSTQVPVTTKVIHNQRLEAVKQAKPTATVYPDDEGKFGRIHLSRMKPADSFTHTDNIHKEPRNSAAREIVIPRSNVSQLRPTTTPEFSVNFYRANPVRQTIHAACRTKAVEITEAPGMAEIKNTEVAAARSNLFEPDMEAEAENNEVLEIEKPKGLFRSFTSRFSKRMTPNSREFQGNIEHKNLKPLADQLNRNQQEICVGIPSEPAKPTFTKIVHLTDAIPRTQGRPLSAAPNTLSNDRERANIQITSSNSGDTGSSCTEDVDTNGTGLSKIRRSFTLRFSKRRTYDGGQLSSSMSDGSEQSPHLQQTNKGAIRRHNNTPVGNYQALRPTVNTEVDGVDMSIPLQQPAVTPTSAATNDAVRNCGQFDEYISESVRPKAMRFLWSVKATSRLPADDIVLAIKRVLNKNRYSYVQQHKYLFICEENARLPVGWEMEICALPKPNHYGIRCKKLSGTSVTYKTVVTKILNELNI